MLAREHDLLLAENAERVWELVGDSLALVDEAREAHEDTKLMSLDGLPGDGADTVSRHQLVD